MYMEMPRQCHLQGNKLTVDSFFFNFKLKVRGGNLF